MDEFYQPKRKLKKPETKESIQYNSIYMKFKLSANESVLFRVRIVVSLGTAAGQ